MRLIDADALPKWTGYALSATEVAIAVEQAPTIDYVPIVRCKDCKHLNVDTMFNQYWCNGREVDLLDYCSRGERRES